MKLNSSILAFSLLALPSLSQAESYQLWSDNPYPAGLNTKVTTETDMTMTINAGGGEQAMVMKTEMTGKKVETINFTAADAVTIKTLEDGFNMSFDVPGMGPQIQAQPGPLRGTTLTGSLEDGKWVLKASEGDPMEVSVTSRQKTLNNQKKAEMALFGQEKRSVGDTWEIKLKDLGNFGEIDGLEGTGTATFTGIEDYDGAKCAKVIYKFEGESDDGVEVLGAVKIKGNITILRDLKLKLNRRSEVKGKLSSNMMPEEAPMTVVTTTEVVAAP